MTPANYLAVEPLLIARLKAQLGNAVEQVGGVAEFEAALDADGPYPAAYVLYAGDRRLDNSGGTGRLLRPIQLWQVGLRTQPMIDPDNGRTSMVQTGTLMSLVIDALAGWRPAPEFQVLKRVQDRGQSVFYASGTALVVLDFEVGVPVTLG